jgi:hypothetical protein
MHQDYGPFEIRSDLCPPLYSSHNEIWRGCHFFVGLWLWLYDMEWNGIGYMAKIDNGLDGKLYREILAGDLMKTLRWYGVG